MDFSTLLPPELSGHVALILMLCALFTSLITATLGAGGGVLLLVIMAIWLPPAAIIPVHGLVQLGSNGGRASLIWRHIDWRVVVPFAPGVVVGMGLGSLVLVALPPAAWQLTIALFILYLCWGPRLPAMALGSPGIFVASALTSFISLFVGATGPLVAAFVKQIHTDRFRTVATFATSMTLQHAPKALVFGLAGFALGQWLPFVAGMVACGFAGTWIGLNLLSKLDDLRFQRVFNLLLTLLALRLLWMAASRLW